MTRVDFQKKSGCNLELSTPDLTKPLKLPGFLPNLEPIWWPPQAGHTAACGGQDQSMPNGPDFYVVECQLAAMVVSTDCACALVMVAGAPALLVKADIAWTSCCTRDASSTVPSLSWNRLS